MPSSMTRLEEADGTAVLTLYRPEKRNALSRALRDEIVQRLEDLAKNDAVRAVVLTGADPVFCAGFDRSELAGGGMEEVFADCRKKAGVSAGVDRECRLQAARRIFVSQVLDVQMASCGKSCRELVLHVWDRPIRERLLRRETPVEGQAATVVGDQPLHVHHLGL